MTGIHGPTHLGSDALARSPHRRSNETKASHASGAGGLAASGGRRVPGVGNLGGRRDPPYRRGGHRAPPDPAREERRE